jgi:hypothetical protein
MKHSSETLGVAVLYRGRLAVIKDSDIQKEGTRDSEKDVGQKRSKTVKSEVVNL